MNTVRLPRIPPPILESESLFRLVPKPMDESGAYKTTGQGSSAYTCLISILADDEAHYNYWNQSFWVHFPDEVEEQAGGEMIYKAFSFSSEHAGEKAGSWVSHHNVVRVVQCEIPDSELAEALLEEQLRKFGKNTWLESRQEQMQNKQIVAEGTGSALGEWVCTQYFITVVCSGSGDQTTCFITDIRCINYELEYEGPGGGGDGGGGDGGPGDDPGECDPQGTEPCYDGPGGSIPPPPEPDPCDGSYPPAWCSNKCETGNDIVDNIGMQETFEYLYNKSNFNLPIDQRSEQGGWIIQDPISNDFGFSEFPEEWPRSPCGIDPPGNFLDYLPPNVIGFVHTHPFSEGEDTTAPDVCGIDGTENYTSGPSEPDVIFLAAIANHLNDHTIKGYVIDGNNISSYNTLSLVTGQFDIYQKCGYSK